MSRGAGIVQRLILDILATDQPTQFNALCWRLAIEGGRFTAPDQKGEIDKSFYSSFQRAVDLLAKRGRVVPSSRKLQNLEDLVTYYPFKTRSVFVKELRQKLLPLARDHFHEQNAARFRKTRTERYLLDQSPETTAAAGRAWPHIENQLFDLVSRFPDERREIILGVLVRGRELFVDGSHASESRSLGALINLALQVEGLGTEERQVITGLRTLYDHCLPPATMNHASLKSQIYSAGNFGRWGSSALSDDIKGALLEKAPDFVAALPGHVAEHRERIGRWTRPRKVEYSRVLNQLIGRDAFSPFLFLTLAPSPPV